MFLWQVFSNIYYFIYKLICILFQVIDIYIFVLVLFVFFFLEFIPHGESKPGQD